MATNDYEKGIKDECYVCGQLCSKNSLKSHLKTHTDNHVYRCDECGRCLKSQKILNKHKTIHQTHYVCRNCYKKFETQNSYERHSCVSKRIKDRICDTCGKAFYSHYDLNRHMRSHTNEKPYTCSICNKGFSQKSNRDIHYQSHLRDKSIPPPVREKKYVCNICFQAFGWRQHLNRHRKIHSGEKPHVCPICERGFNQSTHLKCHLLTHSEEKNFRCEDCGQSFKSYTNMYTHRKRHGEPSIFCPVCKKGFYSSSRYDSHYKTHTKTKPYICDICHEKFSVMDSLIQHYLNHSRRQIGKDNLSEIKLVAEDNPDLSGTKLKQSKILTCIEDGDTGTTTKKISQILANPIDSDQVGMKPLKRKRSQIFRLVNPLKRVRTNKIITKVEPVSEDEESPEEEQQIVVVELQQIKSEILSDSDCEFS